MYEYGNIVDDAVQRVVAGPEMTQAVKTLLIANLQDPEVRAEIAQAARPVAIEGALYVAGAIALVMLVARQS